MKLQLSMLTIAAIAASCGSTGKTGSTASASGKGKKTTISTSGMDKTVRPQDDFFQFSNGTWCKENPVPASESRWGSFNELEQANTKTLTKILEQAQKNPGAKGSQNQLLGDYYTAFGNMENRNKLGVQPINERLKPVSKLVSKDELPALVANLHKKGVNAFFGFGIDQDLVEVSKHSPYIGQAGLGLPNRDYYFDDSKAAIREAYRKYIFSCLQHVGTNKEEIEKNADAILRIETQLAKSSMKPAELRNVEAQYNKYSLADVKRKLLPNFNIESYLTAAGCQSFDTIIVSQPLFIENFNDMVDKLNMDELRAYLSWTVINHYIEAVDEKGEKLAFDFYSGVISGKKEMKPKNERAINELTGSPLGELLGKAFVAESYSEEAQVRVNSMVDNLLLSFEDRIRSLEWMSQETKDEALIKLKAIGRKLGYPEEWKDFSKVDIKADDYAGNLDASSLYSWNENMAKLYKPVNKKEWGMPPHMVNAYYHPLLNEIAFPAGIMQPPFFDVNAEDAVNYGRIGMVIGHEFTHGFDDMGSQFAADGSFSNWWKDTDRQLFEERTKTLGETFSAFCPTPENCVNPELTMGENIADLGGLTMAYYAYTRTPEFQSGEKREGYSPAQRFFIAYAQLWKINYTPQEMQNRLANDSHSPGMYRVNGPLKNCPEFFQAFEVKEGEPMRNSEKQVAKIW